MQAALVIPGGPLVPDLAKARRYGINRLYWEAGDPAISGKLLEDIRAQGFQLGIMGLATGSATDTARQLNADLVRLGMGSRQCAVIADLEMHDPQFVLDFLVEWRKLRPSRETAWTLEPFQGGWFSKALVTAINADPNLIVLHQNYFGDMTPTSADETRRDITRRGVNSERVQSFYAANRVDAGWRGVVFDFGQLR